MADTRELKVYAGTELSIVVKSVTMSVRVQSMSTKGKEIIYNLFLLLMDSESFLSKAESIIHNTLIINMSSLKSTIRQIFSGSKQA